jgi:nicotinic acid mononucleotide adenylyltransferase
MDDIPDTRRILDEAIMRIRRFIGIQIQGMAHLVGEQPRVRSLHSIASCAAERMDELADMVRSGLTNPLRRLRLSPASPPVEPDRSALRVGVYALAANPLHWGHILVGLTALVLMKLDRVVFVVAGEDPRKPFMLPPEVRHRLARAVIDIFKPFFAYSPIALGTNLDGETNLGRLFALNPRLSLHAYYIAGSDHCRRLNEKGEPDTLEKLERVARKLGRGHHSVSAVFIDRPGQDVTPAMMETFLDVHVLPAVPLMCSSTAARHALCTGELTEALAFVPYATFAAIQSLRLFDGGRACRERSA